MIRICWFQFMLSHPQRGPGQSVSKNIRNHHLIFVCQGGSRSPLSLKLESTLFCNDRGSNDDMNRNTAEDNEKSSQSMRRAEDNEKSSQSMRRVPNRSEL